MNYLKNIVVVFVLFIVSSCANTFKDIPKKYHIHLQKTIKNAGENAKELKKALHTVSKEQKEGMAYLISYMPKRDAMSLTANFLIENVKLAYQARKKYSWCKQLPDSIFFNEVLPYANFNETRENWRADFIQRFAPYVEKCNTVEQAIDSINKNINKIVGVEYNTKREKADQSPFESMKQHMASCSGLSIILTDAFRSVGIPSRIAGTPMWTNMKGNHNWSEVWIKGKWFFTEFYPDKLNHSWFLSDAGKANPQKKEHWIYAASWKPTGTHFPLVWDEKIKYIPAKNVTSRYVALYQKQLANQNLNDNELIVNVVLFKSNLDGSQRIATEITVSKDGKKVNWGYTPSPVDDLNKFLKFKLQKNTDYTFSFLSEEGRKITVKYHTKNTSGDTVKLYQDFNK